MMCPDCKAMAEEVGVLKERLSDQFRRLVMFDAMLVQGKLAELPPLPDDGVGVVACCTVLATEAIPNQVIQRLMMSSGRAAAEYEMERASKRVVDALLEAIRPRVQFAQPQHSIERNAMDFTAWLRIAK